MHWNSPCLGASQGLTYLDGVLYKGSHQHDCAFMEGGAMGGYVGGTSRDTFLHRYLVGQDVRDGSFVHWAPNTNAAGETSIGPHVMATDGNQVIVGGDFTRVNGQLQQGLARFEKNGDVASPLRVGVSYNGDPWPNTPPRIVSSMPVTVQPTAAGTLTVEFPAVDDPDTGLLSYRIYRDNAATPVATLQARSWPWSHPVLRFDDTGLAPGSTHSYRVGAFDGSRQGPLSFAVSGTVAASAPSSYGQVQSDFDPALWWGLGDSNGTAADSSGSGAAGTYQGGATRGVSGQLADDAAVELDGSSGYVAGASPIQAPNAFSQAVWFKTDSVRGGTIMAQSDQPTGPGGNTDRIIVMDNNGSLVFAMKSGIGGIFGVGTINIRNQGPVWNDGEWHLAVGTYDGNGNAAFYVDGWLQGAQTGTAFDPAALANGMPTSYVRAGYADLSQIQLVFGINFYGNRWPESDYLDGSIDEVSVYPRALSANEVARLFASGVQGQAGPVVPDPEPPTASFNASTNGLNAAFDGSASDDPDGNVTTYAWNFGDGATQSGPAPTASHSYSSAGTYTVRLTVTDNDGLTGTTTQPVTVTDPPPPGSTTDTTVVESGSVWRWRYEGSAPPSAWNAVGFDHSAWNQGNAILGWGGNETTSLDIYPNTQDRPRAAHFRRAFEIADVSDVQRLVLDSVGNDGVVVYVNGVEVARENMPGGNITHLTWASSARNSANANASPVVVDVPVGLLVTGTNVISAETHVNYRNTRDVEFDLEAVLTTGDDGGGDPPPPPPGSTTDTTVVESGSAWRWRYEGSAPPSAWNAVGFDHSAWNQGNAILGWGANETTSLDIYPNTQDRPRAAHFRRAFEIADVSDVQRLVLDSVGNDGVVVYVNGVEVARENMPGGNITHLTWASSARNSANANASPVVVDVPVGLLVTGTNVISAETHVNYRNTRDVEFDLEAVLTTSD